ncbi:MAG: DUF4442 domain-containing protein [bacterium]|nr:DUF4442 domain-containing protein [bacterium]
MLWIKLPLVAFIGVRLKSISAQEINLTVKYKWLNKNPFNTLYWAVLGMAAELCSGLLILMYAHKKKPGIAMFVVKSSAIFKKRALGKITFTCTQGLAMESCINECIANKSIKTIDCKTIACDEANDIVAEFVFTWSIKGRD